MEHYVGLDVSLKLTAICIVDQKGKIIREGMVASNPEAIAAFVRSNAPHVVRAAVINPLLKAREAIEQEIAGFDRKVMRLAQIAVNFRDTSSPTSCSTVALHHCKAP